MSRIDERDLDLNLLRVLVVVADEGSVTRAAARLYLTQSAVSAALRRLQDALGAELLARQGRGVALTARGLRTVESARPHLRALLDAARAPHRFEAADCARTFRVGMPDEVQLTLLPALLRRLRAKAPGARLVVLPVQFRTVNDVLRAHAVDLAVTVADDTPPHVAREPLGTARFVCVFDPKGAALGATITRGEYARRAHVIVSYNGDLRGVVEDATTVRRDVACSVSSFANLGVMLVGSDLIATVPARVAAAICATHRRLRSAPLPFALPAAPLEMLWNRSADDDALAWLRGEIRGAYAEKSGR